MISIRHKNLVDTITPETIKEYLTRSGWVLDTDYKNKKLFLFEKSIDNETLSILIPNKDNYIDFKPKVYDAACAISEIYEMDIEMVLSEMAKPCVDIYEYHFKSEILKSGTLPLDVGSKIIQGIKDFILYSACAEELPRFKISRPSNHSSNFINTTRLAQTGVGSYIIRVEFYNDEKVTQPEINLDCSITEPLPFTRKVIKRMQKSLTQIKEIKDTKDIDSLVQDAFEVGINGNICKAISDIYTPFKEMSESLDLVTNVNFSICDTPVEDIPKEVILNNMDFNFVSILSDVYEKSDVIKNKELIGYLSSISKHENYGQVRIKTEIDTVFKTISAVLENEMFREACYAMAENKQIKIHGDLDTTGKIWFMDNISKFYII